VIEFRKPFVEELEFSHTIGYNTSMSNFTPTDEQQACIDAFLTNGSMVIDAGAGTGKTTTLRSMAAADTRRGVYLAFNRKTADEADASFPSHVLCKTGHSLSGGYRKFADRISSSQRTTMRDNANILGVYESLQVAQRAWADLQNPAGRLGGFRSIGHDVYLKLWALSEPTIQADYILLDEAQDSNPVIVDLVMKQSAQKIMVGDRNQAIYGWRGAENAMTEFDADHHLALTQSWRFGQAIADEANKWLTVLGAEVNGVPFRIIGNPHMDSRVEPLERPDTILCRTNAGALEAALNAQGRGYATAIVGGVRELQQFVEAANDLIAGQRTWHPDLATFGSWNEVQDYSEKDEGADLKKWVRMIDTHGTHTILEVCQNTVDERKGNPDIIVSTAHKAKGMEWSKVQIAPDFPKPDPEKDGGEVSRPEAMLSYVAVTRAKDVLDNHGLAWIDDLMAGTL
jgi:hypothetical protein